MAPGHISSFATATLQLHSSPILPSATPYIPENTPAGTNFLTDVEPKCQPKWGPPGGPQTGTVGFGTPRAQSHVLPRFPTKKSSGPILGTAFRSPFGDRLAVPFWVPLFGPAVVSTAEQSWTKGRDDTQWICCTVSERDPQTHERIAPHANWSSAAWWGRSACLPSSAFPCQRSVPAP